MSDAKPGDYTISLLEPPYFEHYWPYIQQEMDRIPHTWQSRMSKDVLFDEVLARRMQCWAMGPRGAYTMIVFTCINIYPTSKALVVQFAFGVGADEALPVMDATFEKFAFVNHCDRIEVVGRAGWSKKLKALGFQTTSFTMERPVQHIGVQ